jgi:hypothetical protein
MRFEIKDISRIEYFNEKPNQGTSFITVSDFRLGEDGLYHFKSEHDEKEHKKEPHLIKNVFFYPFYKNIKHNWFVVKDKIVSANFKCLKGEVLVLESEGFDFIDFDRNLTQEVDDLILGFRANFSHFKEQEKGNGYVYFGEKPNGLVFEIPKEISNKYSIPKACFTILKNNLYYLNVNAFSITFESNQGITLSLETTYNDIVEGEDVHSSLDRLLKMVELLYSQRDFIGI